MPIQSAAAVLDRHYLELRCTLLDMAAAFDRMERAGEFAAIKVKTYPRYEGVFMNKGEVFIWLTDDSRRVPVFMKSTLKFGSFVFTLLEMQPGAAAR